MHRFVLPPYRVQPLSLSLSLLFLTRLSRSLSPVVRRLASKPRIVAVATTVVGGRVIDGLDIKPPVGHTQLHHLSYKEGRRKKEEGRRETTNYEYQLAFLTIHQET